GAAHAAPAVERRPHPRRGRPSPGGRPLAQGRGAARELRGPGRGAAARRPGGDPRGAARPLLERQRRQGRRPGCRPFQPRVRAAGGRTLEVGRPESNPMPHRSYWHWLSPRRLKVTRRRRRSVSLRLEALEARWVPAVKLLLPLDATTGPVAEQIATPGEADTF